LQRGWKECGSRTSEKISSLSLLSLSLFLSHSLKKRKERPAQRKKILLTKDTRDARHITILNKGFIK